jgi:flagellar biosynthesis/type III secretory pathway protein FliH
MRSSSAAFEFEQLDADAVVARPADGPVRLAQAADVLETARREADAIRETAREEGFQFGYTQGLASVDERLAPAASALAEAHAALGAERANAADAVERDAVELALRIAEKALSATIEARPEHVIDVVRGGLRRLLERDRVLVLVHPDDLDLVRRATEGLKGSLGGIGELEVQAERRVGRGGAIVRTAAGEVDGRLETQLERAREALVGALGEGDDA